MRMLLNVILPHEPFNAAVRKGTVGDTIAKILEAAKPEAVYFTEQDGHRSALLIVNVENPSQVPALAEPWFLHFSADVQFRIVMTPDDLKRANLAELGTLDDLIRAILTEPGLDTGLPPREVERQIRCGIEHARRQRGEGGADG